MIDTRPQPAPDTHRSSPGANHPAPVSPQLISFGPVIATTASSAVSNGVALDNKIEQAMDLVKSHLLYAVREEVEILREKIVELEKKVVRLEAENKFLRDHVSPEVIAQLSGGTVYLLTGSGVSSSAVSQFQPVAVCTAVTTATTDMSNASTGSVSLTPPFATSSPILKRPSVEKGAVI
ncbi:unnamed protein product [Soboliphyme baturini]|uniref:TSC22 domain family protein 1 n=1 Tax=Soboliphyme baturini TaxID=241478 RepID=A0A183IND7_9BILA|nr:unnamed protein product [Soboliphyme baturini]